MRQFASCDGKAVADHDDVGRQQARQAEPEDGGDGEQRGHVLGQQEADQRRRLHQRAEQQGLEAADPVAQPAPELARQEGACPAAPTAWPRRTARRSRDRRSRPRRAASASPWARSSRRPRSSAGSSAGWAAGRASVAPLRAAGAAPPSPTARRARGCRKIRVSATLDDQHEDAEPAAWCGASRRGRCRTAAAAARSRRRPPGPRRSAPPPSRGGARTSRLT